MVGMLPNSQRSVKLAFVNLASRPLLDFNDYGTGADRYSMCEGIRQILNDILYTLEERDMIEDCTLPPGCQKLALHSFDEEIDAHVRQVTATASHPGGTATMDDVIDSEMKVIGIDVL